MKHDIQIAYDAAAPDPNTVARIYDSILQAADAEPTPRRRQLLRRVVLAAACIALIAALAIGGYAAYQKWSLPDPEPLVPDENGGFYEEHTRMEYTVPPTAAPDSGAPETTAEPASLLSDEALMLRSLEILQQAGLEGVRPETMTVIRQKHLYWDREESVVSFLYNGLQTSVTFDAETGVFLGMSGIDWVLEDVRACETRAEADALARRYYESLPVEQGYVLRGCEQYDEQFWSYDFCREVEPGLLSDYECVRISINPVSGQLIGTTVFYVPLLDDHAPGDVPLTQSEAEAIAEARLGETLQNGYVLRSAERKVCLPNWNFSDKDTALFAKAADVTRLCWYLTYENPESEYSDQIFLMIDYYTGEILGGDVSG